MKNSEEQTKGKRFFEKHSGSEPNAKKNFCRGTKTRDTTEAGEERGRVKKQTHQDTNSIEEGGWEKHGGRGGTGHRRSHRFHKRKKKRAGGGSHMLKGCQ